MSHNSRGFINFFKSYSHSPHFQSANNNITIRPNTIYEALPQIQPSDSLLEASFKTRRLYKRICRIVLLQDALHFEELWPWVKD